MVALTRQEFDAISANPIGTLKPFQVRKILAVMRNHPDITGTAPDYLNEPTLSEIAVAQSWL